MYQSGRRARELYEDFSTFMERFHVSGLARVGVELSCEALTLGLGAGIVAMALASSAFQMTSDENWLKQTDLAVTFLDRYGAEVGQRGIKHDDAVPLDQYPDYLIKAVLATEDRRFYEHFGIDVIGTLRALTVNARSSGVVQGGSSISQQLAKNLFLSNERTITRKINEAFLALWLEHPRYAARAAATSCAAGAGAGPGAAFSSSRSCSARAAATRSLPTKCAATSAAPMPEWRSAMSMTPASAFCSSSFKVRVMSAIFAFLLVFCCREKMPSDDGGGRCRLSDGQGLVRRETAGPQPIVKHERATRRAVHGVECRGDENIDHLLLIGGQAAPCELGMGGCEDWIVRYRHDDELRYSWWIMVR